MFKYVLLLICLNCVSCMKPVLINEINTETESNLYWREDRKLTWNDFQGIPIDTTIGKSEIVIQIPSFQGSVSPIFPSTIKVYSFFDKKRSWVNRKGKDQDLLLYNQVIFDIYELYTRKMRKELSNVKGWLNLSSQFVAISKNITNELYDKISEFRTATKLGSDSKAIKFWYEDIRKKLLELNDFATK